MAIRSVHPSALYEEWFKTIETFITPPAEACAKSLELLLRHIENLAFRSKTRIFFRAGEVSWNKITSINI